VRLALFINGKLGLQVLNFLLQNSNHKIVAIVLNSQEKRSTEYVENVKNLLGDSHLPQIILWENMSKGFKIFHKELESPSHAVSALFGHILPEDLIKEFTGGVLNLHPSLLPIGRGAHPISWSIMDEQPQGITLHLIDQGLDTGNIVFQKEIFTNVSMSAGEIYEIAMTELLESFSKYFPRWIKGELDAYAQSESIEIRHTSKEMKSLRTINENEVSTFGGFVRRLQATTFSDGRLPIYIDNLDNMWEINFHILPQQNPKKSGE
jgi:methionyl-tRNA formyltransferase